MKMGRFGNSANGKFTEALNGIKSTLSKSWAATKQGHSLNQDIFSSGLKRFRGKDNMEMGFGAAWDTAKSGWKSGDKWTRGGQIAAATGVAAGGIATADFLNPWGLGWGD